MIVDSSALIAVIFGEPEAGTLLPLLLTSPPRISAANYFETAMVVDRKSLDDVPPQALARLLAVTKVEVVPVTQAQADLARAAYRKYGKGNHPAALNFGDCFAYALAKETGEPLLFKGSDFAQTDVKSAI